MAVEGGGRSEVWMICGGGRSRGAGRRRRMAEKAEGVSDKAIGR